MSSATDTRSYTLEPAALADALVAAGPSLKLRQKGRSDNLVTMGEGFKLLGFSWPATITATITPSAGKTSVEYRASNFGFGPVQTGHCKKLIEKVIAALADKEAR